MLYLAGLALCSGIRFNRIQDKYFFPYLCHRVKPTLKLKQRKENWKMFRNFQKQFKKQFKNGEKTMLKSIQLKLQTENCTMTVGIESI